MFNSNLTHFLKWSQLCILHHDGELFEQVFGVLTFQLHEMCREFNKQVQNYKMFL